MNINEFPIHDDRKYHNISQNRIKTLNFASKSKLFKRFQFLDPFLDKNILKLKKFLDHHEI